MLDLPTERAPPCDPAILSHLYNGYNVLQVPSVKAALLTGTVLKLITAMPPPHCSYAYAIIHVLTPWRVEGKK